MKPYIPVSEMFWRPDAAIDELRKRDGWAEFHRAAGKRGLYFDLTVKEGRRYKNTVFTLKKSASKTDFYHTFFVADGDGKTPLDAFEAAYAATGRCDDELDALVARIKGEKVVSVPAPAPVVADELDALFDDAVGESGGDDDEFEDLFG